jgi:formylmethanofuran--tetrahydromethanopterin N-formyltransferase
LEHIEMAKRRNLSYTVHDSFFISADIDEEDDLMELLIHGKSYSAEYLRMIGVFIHVDKKTKVRAKVDRYDEKTETFITSTSSSFFEVKGKKMELEGVEIEDTFAEAFPIKVARVLITAVNEKWAMTAAREMTGFGTSVIMCPAEAGIDKIAAPEETPDGRPGVYAMICTFGYKALDEQLLARIGQCILTSPTAAVFNAMAESEKEFNTGFKLKFFGDGFESEEELDGREVVRVPIMGGEFVIEKNLGAKAGVAGGNIFILAKDQMAALTAAEDAVDAIQEVEGTITPFTGGVVASGSKPSSNRYKFMHATINEKFCPTLKDKIEDTELPADVNGVFEIVINGVSEDAVKEAMKAGIKAAVKVPGVVKITAGNFGGKLGKYQLRLKDVLGL